MCSATAHVRFTFLERTNCALGNIFSFVLEAKKGGSQMPTKVNVELIVVWACVGFFTGAGWATATWLVGRILGLTHL
jgi:hypothetical protein